MAWLVIVWQLFVKYRRKLSVGKAVGINLKNIYNLLRVKNSNKQIKLD
jgi:hypothetical protein